MLAVSFRPSARDLPRNLTIMFYPSRSAWKSDNTRKHVVVGVAFLRWIDEQKTRGRTYYFYALIRYNSVLMRRWLQAYIFFFFSLYHTYVKSNTLSVSLYKSLLTTVSSCYHTQRAFLALLIITNFLDFSGLLSFQLRFHSTPRVALFLVEVQIES